MTQIASALTMFDTLLGGVAGRTSSYLVHGEAPAVVDPGAETSAPVLIGLLGDAGIGPDDLAWIVLTHIHLDHCGGTGALAAAFPSARVVVWDRAARHIAQPQRLVEASHVVYGRHAAMYGGLSPVPEHRIVPAADGHRVPVGAGRELHMLWTPGHARHHMSVVDTATGTVMAGDALGSHLHGGGLYPNTPPSDADPPTGRASLARIREWSPTVISAAHFGPVGPVDEALDRADAQLAVLQQAAVEGWARGGLDGVRAAVDERLPLEATLGDAHSAREWRELEWFQNNAEGLAAWAERAATPPS